ncbi:MAG: transglutaminase family protein, partial [Planctomycetota bacterium]
MHTSKTRRQPQISLITQISKKFIFFICAICGFKCFFIGLMPTSFDLLAESLRPNPVWEVNTTDTSLATNALKIAKESYPEIDSEYYLKKIENIIENIRTSLRDETEPEQILKTMNVVLFNELQFKYVQTGDLEHISLNKVLDTKIGNCVGLSILYLCIAEGLHLPI